jgi:hypothetical protein
LETATVKEQVWALANELNAALGVPLIQPYQQEIAAKNISLTGRERERLYIKPARDGYMIALGGSSLVARMEPFMEHLTGRERHGYYHPHVNREPYRYVSDYAQVRDAAYFYAGATAPLDGDETIDADLEAISRRPDLKPTQCEALIQARLGQGTYRRRMLELWNGKCAATGLTIQSALIASHAKRWVDSTDEERLDPCNGLPLMATLDRLFDKHLIAFTPETGKMLISHRVHEADRAILGIPANLRKIPNERQAHYLKLHLDKFELQKVR